MALGPMQQDEEKTTWADIKKTGISGSVQWKRAGDIVMLRIHVSGLTQSTYTTVGTIPQEVRASGEIYACAKTGYNSNNTAIIYIDTSGAIQVYPYSATGAYVDFTYII